MACSAPVCRLEQNRHLRCSQQRSASMARWRSSAEFRSGGNFGAGIRDGLLQCGRFYGRGRELRNFLTSASNVPAVAFSRRIAAIIPTSALRWFAVGSRQTIFLLDRSFRDRGEGEAGENTAEEGGQSHGTASHFHLHRYSYSNRHGVVASLVSAKIWVAMSRNFEQRRV